MKAFVLEKYGHPMREVSMPEPTAGPRQVLVRMIAAGVNHADERTLRIPYGGAAVGNTILPAVASDQDVVAGKADDPAFRQHSLRRI